jgi:hypothetical protein
MDGWIRWKASELAAQRKNEQKPTAEPVEIADTEHELVVERAAAIDVAKATGKVCVRVPGNSGRRVSRVWDVAVRGEGSGNRRRGAWRFHETCVCGLL